MAVIFTLCLSMSANTAHTDSCPVCVLIRRYSYLTLCGMRVNEWPASKICNFPPHPVTPLISNSKVRCSLTNMFYIPILDTRAGCLAPRPILQICATTQSTWSLSIYSLVACCVDMFSVSINEPLRSSLQIVTAFLESATGIASLSIHLFSKCCFLPDVSPLYLR